MTPRILIIPAVAIFWLLTLPRVTAASVQILDEIHYGDRDVWILDQPLEHLWKDPSRRPTFTGYATNNRKGYTARWMVKDSKLFLISFKAEVKNKEINISAIIRGAILPHHATWFTGKLHVVLGERVSDSGYLNPRFEAIDVLTIENGIIKERTRRRNAGKE